jgi:hypothetical protein
VSITLELDCFAVLQTEWLLGKTSMLTSQLTRGGLL